MFSLQNFSVWKWKETRKGKSKKKFYSVSPLFSFMNGWVYGLSALYRSEKSLVHFLQT